MKKILSYIGFISLAALSSACSLVNTSELKPGVGSHCISETDCHAGYCYYPKQSLPKQRGGICTTSCQRGCPLGSVCVVDHCESKLDVTALLVGTSSTREDSWSYGHYQGIKEASARSDLSDFMNVEYLNYVDIADLESIVSMTQSRQGRQLIVGNTIEYYPILKQLAAALPSDSNLNIYAIDDGFKVEATTNFASYWISINHAIYVAGQLAAQVVLKNSILPKRIGIVSTIVNPETVQEVNAFTLGARSVKGAENIEVEVRYIGFWSDLSDQGIYQYPLINPKETSLFREEYLTDLLIASGCQVIAHLGNTQRTVKHLDKHREAGEVPMNRYAFAKNLETACQDPENDKRTMPACLGSIFLNWTNVYERIFRTARLRGSIDLEPINYDLGTPSPEGVHVGIRAGNQTGLLGRDDTALSGILEAEKNTEIWPRKMDGSHLTKSEINSMCFYVPGVVEKVNFSDTSPNGGYRNAVVPGNGYNYPASDPDWPAVRKSLKEKLRFNPNTTDQQKNELIDNFMHCQRNASIAQ